MMCVAVLALPTQNPKYMSKLETKADVSTFAAFCASNIILMRRLSELCKQLVIFTFMYIPLYGF